MESCYHLTIITYIHSFFFLFCTFGNQREDDYFDKRVNWCILCAWRYSIMHIFYVIFRSYSLLYDNMYFQYCYNLHIYHRVGRDAAPGPIKELKPQSPQRSLVENLLPLLRCEILNSDNFKRSRKQKSTKNQFAISVSPRGRELDN